MDRRCQLHVGQVLDWLEWVLCAGWFPEHLEQVLYEMNPPKMALGEGGPEGLIWPMDQPHIAHLAHRSR